MVEKKLFLTIPLLLPVLGYLFTGAPLWFWSSSPEMKYQIKEIGQKNPSEIDESFTITGQRQVAGFSQKLVTWSDAEDRILLELEMDKKQIIIQETYTSTETTINTSLYMITGDITHLQPGSYNVKVFWTTKVRNQTELLFTDSISVEREGLNWIYVVVPGIITGTVTAGAVYLIMKKKKREQ